MAFTVQDFHDLVRLLGQHPEWRQELRRLVLAEDLLELPRLVRELGEQTQQLAEAQRRTEARLEALAARVQELAEAQRRTEARLESLAARVEELAEAQRRTEARLESLAARVQELAEAQRRTEARLEALAARVEEVAEAQRRTEARLEELAEAQRQTEQRLEALAQAQRETERRLEALAEAQRETERRLAALAESTDRRFRELQAELKDLKDDVADLKGRDLERLYRDRAAGYFGRVLRGLRVLTDAELDRLLESALAQESITWEERSDLMEADVVAQGRLRSTGQEAYLVVEVSWRVDRDDVVRAHRRAGILSKVSGLTLAAVAGKSITTEAEELAQRLRVLQVTDGAVAGSASTP